MIENEGREEVEEEEEEGEEERGNRKLKYLTHNSVTFFLLTLQVRD